MTMSEYRIINGVTHLTRAQRRELKRLSRRVDRITHADRKFFERFPGRRHRMRVAHRAELEQGALVLGESVIPLPDGMIHFAAVRNIRTGFRLRVFFAGNEMLDVDLSESAAWSVFMQIRTKEMIEAERIVAEVYGIGEEE
jgi:hypothetical protein